MNFNNPNIYESDMIMDKLFEYAGVYDLKLLPNSRYEHFWVMYHPALQKDMDTDRTEFVKIMVGKPKPTAKFISSEYATQSYITNLSGKGSISDNILDGIDNALKIVEEKHKDKSPINQVLQILFVNLGASVTLLVKEITDIETKRRQFSVVITDIVSDDSKDLQYITFSSDIWENFLVNHYGPPDFVDGNDYQKLNSIYSTSIFQSNNYEKLEEISKVLGRKTGKVIYADSFPPILCTIICKLLREKFTVDEGRMLCDSPYKANPIKISAKVCTVKYKL